MKKIEIRAVIKYLHLKGMSASEIHDDMLKALAAVSLHMQHVGSENSSVKGDQRSEQPQTATRTTLTLLCKWLARSSNILLSDSRYGVPKKCIHTLNICPVNFFINNMRYLGIL